MYVPEEASLDYYHSITVAFLAPLAPKTCRHQIVRVEEKFVGPIKVLCPDFLFGAFVPCLRRAVCNIEVLTWSVEFLFRSSDVM